MVTRWDADVRETVLDFVSALNFRAKLLSRRKFVRCDNAKRNVFGLRDLEKGIVYYVHAGDFFLPEANDRNSTSGWDDESSIPS